MADYLPYIQVALSVIMIAAIMLQRSEAALGSAFGESWSSSFHTRRGFEKYLFYATIVIAILFAISAFAALIIQ